MGIKGLVTFCKNANCYEEYDLVSLSKRIHDMEILVDFYGIEQHILELSLKNMAAKYRNEYLIIPGSEYDEIINAFREFHQVFKNLGINLVFIADGPKGLDKVSQLGKEKSWIFRLEKSLKLQERYMEYCKNPQSPFQIIRETIIRPLLMQDIFKGIIKRQGGEIISLVYGEADNQIAMLRQQRNSWAVLTNDSDFFAFENCPTIQIAFFDLERDLMMGRSYRQGLDGEFCCLKPQKLIVGVISGSILMSRLGITKYERLIDYSILMGNDYTIDFAIELRDFCNIKWKYDYSDVADSVVVANWVEKQSTCILESDVFKRFLAIRPDAEQYVKFSMNFYRCKLTDPVPTFTSERNERLWKYIEDRYKNIDIPSVALSVFYGFCYQKNCVEPHNTGKDRDINSLLIPLMKKIYGLFLQEGMSTVVTYEVPNCQDYSRKLIIEDSYQKIDDIVNPTTNISYNEVNLKDSSWKFFEESWSYWDFENSTTRYFRSLDYFRRFRTDIGFCCYCLRTMWQLVGPSSSDNKLEPGCVAPITLSENEFRAVFCTVFFRLLDKLQNLSGHWYNLHNRLVLTHPNAWFFQLRLCPSSTCLIVQEWLQTIYHLAYNTYGRSVRISHFFPETFQFLSGTVLTAFFEYVHNRGQRLRSLDSSRINEVYELMSSLMDEFGHVYDAIIRPF